MILLAIDRRDRDDVVQLRIDRLCRDLEAVGRALTGALETRTRAAAGVDVQPVGSVSASWPFVGALALCITVTSRSTVRVGDDSGTTAVIGETVTAIRGTVRTSRTTKPYGRFGSRRLTTSIA